MRLELAIDVPAKLIEERHFAHQLIADALCEYTVHCIRNNVNPAAVDRGAVGIDGQGVLECRNGVKIVETLVASA